jgi:hypothetical protein
MKHQHIFKEKYIEKFCQRILLSLFTSFIQNLKFLQTDFTFCSFFSSKEMDVGATGV